MAEIATGHREEALDIVQDSMMKLVQAYGDRNEDEWAPLFYRILQNRIMDWHRKRGLTTRIFSWFGASSANDEEDEVDWSQTVADRVDNNPHTKVATMQELETLHGHLHDLPIRQQQAFLLRSIEGFDVRTTASIMECSEGSVKTHYSRALNGLKKKMGGEV